MLILENGVDGITTIEALYILVNLKTLIAAVFALRRLKWDMKILITTV